METSQDVAEAVESLEQHLEAAVVNQGGRKMVENGVGVDLAVEQAQAVAAGYQQGQDVHVTQEQHTTVPEGTEVILVYQDILTCGTCSRQFLELQEYLEHKTEHVTSSGTHICELCKWTCAHQLELITHYRKKHRLAHFAQDIPLDSSQDREEDIVEAGEEKGEVVENGQGKSDKTVTSAEKAGLPEKAHSPNENREPNDFHFIFVSEMVKGHSFQYGRSSFKCLHCQYKTYSKQSIGKHMRDKHEDLLAINQSISIKDQVSVDNQRIMSMCQYTAMNMRNKKKRKNPQPRRLEKQDLPGVFPCGSCEKVFGRLRYLRKHMETHRTERKFLCDECGKGFKSRAYLTIHRKTHKDKLFHCTQCSFTSGVPAAIHAHRQLHSQGSVLCDICGYAYLDKSTLNKHKRVHDLSRPYACTFPECTWRFKTEVMCKAHIRAHTTEGKFKCSACGYVFRHKHHLQRHEAKMHGIDHKQGEDPRMGEDFGAEMEVADTVSLVVNSELDAEQLHQLQQTLQQHQQQLVVTTDVNGTPITYEAADISALNVAYQALMQSAGQESQSHDTPRTVLITQTATNQMDFQEQ